MRDKVYQNWNLSMVKTILVDPISLKSRKICACGRIHSRTTKNAVISKDGYILFNCQCGSTLLVMEKVLDS